MKSHLLIASLVAGLFACPALPAVADEERDLLDILRSAPSPIEKADAAGRLRSVGTAQAVPALATLLANETTSHAARHALEGMPYPEAGAALRQALASSSGLIKAGLIDSLGWRREPEAVPLLGPLLSDQDAVLASAAASALGRIGDDTALTALETALHRISIIARPALLDGLMRCAELRLKQGDRARATTIYQSLLDSTDQEPIRTAAYSGLIRSADDGGFGLIMSALEGDDPAAETAALQLAGDLRNPEATEALSALVPSSPPARQIALLALLQARGEPAALPAVLTATRDSHPQVRAAAVSALGALGDVTSVGLLLEAATSTNTALQAAARQALVVLRRGEITDALTSALRTTAPAAHTEIVRALSARSDPVAVPALLELAGDESSPARRAALQALGQLVDGSHMDSLVLLLVNSRSQTARDQVRGVFESLIERTPDPRQLELESILSGLAGEQFAVREALLPVSVLFLDDRIRDALRQALRDRDATIRNAAARALCTSLDPELLPDLLELARQSEDMSLRSLALDGSIRVATDERSALSKQQRVDALAAGYLVANRPEDKRMILSGLARVPHPVTLGLAEKACADAAVKPEAELACLQIARGLGTTEFDMVEAALARLSSDAGDPSLRTNAQALLKQLDSGWMCAGPWRADGRQAQDLFDIEFPPELPNPADIQWQRAPGSVDLSRTGEVDLAGIAGGDHCVVYAKTRVYVPTSQVIVLAIGSDDGIKLWVNGELVHANNAVRGLTPGQDRAVARLREGWNDVLAKVTQHTLGCGLIVSITISTGAEVPGLRWSPR
jgi:HEAT repeat protein